MMIQLTSERTVSSTHRRSTTWSTGPLALWRGRMPATIIRFFLLLAIYCPGGETLPNGAPMCSGGIPAVGGGHLSNGTPTNGTLEEGGYALQIFSRAMTTEGPIYMEPGEYPFSVVRVRTNVTGFKGALVRLESSPVESAEAPVTLYRTDTADTSMQDATACVAPVLGLTHTDNSVKTELNGSFNITPGTNTTLYMDVTVVDFNNNTGSQYWFSRFTFEVREELPNFPTVPPKFLPTHSPTQAPAPTVSPEPVLVQPATNPAPGAVGGTPTIMPSNNGTSTNNGGGGGGGGGGGTGGGGVGGGGGDNSNTTSAAAAPLKNSPVVVVLFCSPLSLLLMWFV